MNYTTVRLPIIFTVGCCPAPCRRAKRASERKPCRWARLAPLHKGTKLRAYRPGRDCPDKKGAHRAWFRDPHPIRAVAVPKEGGA